MSVVDWTIKWLRLSDGQYQAQEPHTQNYSDGAVQQEEVPKPSGDNCLQEQKLYQPRSLACCCKEVCVQNFNSQLQKPHT